MIFNGVVSRESHETLRKDNRPLCCLTHTTLTSSLYMSLLKPTPHWSYNPYIHHLYLGLGLFPELNDVCFNVNCNQGMSGLKRKRKSRKRKEKKEKESREKEKKRKRDKRKEKENKKNRITGSKVHGNKSPTYEYLGFEISNSIP